MVTNNTIQLWYPETKRLPLRNHSKFIMPNVFAALKSAAKKNKVAIGALVGWEILEETGIIDNIINWVTNNPDIASADQDASVKQLVGITSSILEQIAQSTNGLGALQAFEDGRNAVYFVQKFTASSYDDWSMNDYYSENTVNSARKNTATKWFRNSVKKKK